MRLGLAAGFVGVLVTVALNLVLTFSLAGSIAAGIVAFMMVLVLGTMLTTQGPIEVNDTSANAVKKARKRLKDIRVYAIKAQSQDLIQAAADLNASYEDVFEQIKGRRDGYARVGLTLALLKPLVEATEECTRHRTNTTKFPEMVEQLKDAFEEARKDLDEKAEDLTDDDLEKFEIKCNTVKRIADRD